MTRIEPSERHLLMRSRRAIFAVNSSDLFLLRTKMYYYAFCSSFYVLLFSTVLVERHFLFSYF